MIYKNKQEGEIQGYYIGAEDNSRYCICVCIFFFFFFHVTNLTLMSGNNRFCLLALGLKFNVRPGPRSGPISANPGLNLNPGFFFFCSKAFYRRIFSILFRALHYQVVDKNNKTGFAFKAFISQMKFCTNPGLS